LNPHQSVIMSYNSSNGRNNSKYKSNNTDSDSEDEKIRKRNNNSKQRAVMEPSGPPRGINELLKKALECAAEPGLGDEDPEVLEDPNVANRNEMKRGGDSKDDEPDAKQRKGDENDRNKEMEEEERKQAELTFDHNALLPSQSMSERAKYIPLRLTYDERKSLRLVNASINVSDYTTVVDIPFRNKARRNHLQLQHIVAFLTGLIAATDYEKGQQVLADRNFESFEDDIKTVLEIARRYKITNPEKMRSEYGKLVYLMQDAVSESTKPLLGISIHTPIKTVYDLLKNANSLAMLDDAHIGTATEEILPDKSKNRATIQMEIKRKERSAEIIVRKYANNRLSADDIRSCLYSISDNNSFLNSNKKPVTDCIQLLKRYFHPSVVEAEYSLSIQEGISGARLSHTHELQYNYVLQSLTLWEAILEDTFRLWYLAEQDLLSETQPYELKNTGQGLQRVQQSPRVFKAMHEILIHTQNRLGGWVGSSVIHLGDHNVPNTLVFIDKYTQVARILGPIVVTLSHLEIAGLNRYLQAYGGIEKAKKDILHDFFTHAFDGSGGDNFFDAGSCIDGRLTSAWNWCSQLASKPFYPLFKLTGFLSFDGQFDK